MTLAPFVDSGTSAKSDCAPDDDEQRTDGVTVEAGRSRAAERCEPDDCEGSARAGARSRPASSNPGG